MEQRGDVQRISVHILFILYLYRQHENDNMRNTNSL